MLKKVFKGIGIGVGMTTGALGLYMYSNLKPSTDLILEESELPPISVFARHFYAGDLNEEFVTQTHKKFQQVTGQVSINDFRIMFDNEHLLENPEKRREAHGIIIESEEDYLKIQKYIEEKKDEMLTLTKLPKTKCIATSYSISSIEEAKEKMMSLEKVKEYLGWTHKDHIRYVIARFYSIDGKTMIRMTNGMIEDTRGPYGFSPLPQPIRK